MDLVLTTGGNPAVLLRRWPNNGDAQVFVLESAGACIALVSDAIRSLAPTDGFDRRELFDLFHAAALEKGWLRYPPGPLEAREDGVEGPPRCHNQHCRAELSHANGSLGCSQCPYYACERGHCLCGYTGTNYLHRFFKQFPALPILPSERQDFIRVVRYCIAGAGALAG